MIESILKFSSSPTPLYVKQKNHLLKRPNLLNLDVFHLLLSLKRIFAKGKVFVHLLIIIIMVTYMML